MHMTAEYFRYWGKTRSDDESGSAFHLLPYHCLDVAGSRSAVAWMGIDKLVRIVFVRWTGKLSWLHLPESVLIAGKQAMNEMRYLKNVAMLITGAYQGPHICPPPNSPLCLGRGYFFGEPA